MVVRGEVEKVYGLLRVSLSKRKKRNCGLSEIPKAEVEPSCRGRVVEVESEVGVPFYNLIREWMIYSSVQCLFWLSACFPTTLLNTPHSDRNIAYSSFRQ